MGGMVEWSQLDLRTGEVRRIVVSESTAQLSIEVLSAQRRAARRPDGSYPPIIHGIRRNPPAVNAQ